MEEFEIEIEMWVEVEEQQGRDNGGLDHKRGAGESLQCGTHRAAQVCFDQKNSQFGSHSWELFKMILCLDLFNAAAEDTSIK